MTVATSHTPGAAVADPFLAEKAATIRTLGSRVVRDVIEIGRHLTEAKGACRHGEWLPWLEREFAWKEQTARNFMAAYALVGKSPNFGDLSLDISSLYLLASPSTPQAARDEVLDAVKTGEKVPRAEVERIVDEAKEKIGRQPRKAAAEQAAIAPHSTAQKPEAVAKPAPPVERSADLVVRRIQVLDELERLEAQAERIGAEIAALITEGTRIEAAMTPAQRAKSDAEVERRRAAS